MKKSDKIFIAGYKNIMGPAISHYFRSRDFNSVITDSDYKLNLADQDSVCRFFEKERPKYIFLFSAESGGIIENIEHPAELIYNNLQIQNNIIHYSFKFGVKKLLFLGSSCIYPGNCPQPIKEEYLLSGELEGTSEPYSIAKIAGIKTCQSYSRQYGAVFISAVPSTIYGPGDNFDLKTGHVISSLVRKFHEAKENGLKNVVIWGTGKPRREFLYVNDAAQACVFLMDNYSGPGIINIGPGEDMSIEELASVIKDIVGFGGGIVFDASKPDGVLQKLLDNSRITKLGWRTKISLKEGIRQTYIWYKERQKIKLGV